MNTTLKSRIARIASPNVVELDLKRRAKFGKLNVSAAFDIVSLVSATEKKSDIRHAFARQVTGEAKKPQEFWGR